jgi:hypothetical protein
LVFASLPCCSIPRKTKLSTELGFIEFDAAQALAALAATAAL